MRGPINASFRFIAATPVMALIGGGILSLIFFLIFSTVFPELRKVGIGLVILGFLLEVFRIVALGSVERDHFLSGHFQSGTNSISFPLRVSSPSNSSVITFPPSSSNSSAAFTRAPTSLSFTSTLDTL